MVFCLGCLAVPALGSLVLPTAAATGVGASAAYYIKSKKNKNKNKKKKEKTKKNKKDKKKKKTLMKGGSGNLKKEEKSLKKEYSKCHSKSYKNMKFKKRRGVPLNEWYQKMTPLEKKQYNKEKVNTSKCYKKCSRVEKEKLKTHTKKFSKDYRILNKENQKNCCRCKYIQKNGKYFTVKGPYSHCSYDMTNCCER